MPAALLLDSWAGDLTNAFGAKCYLVGSAVTGKGWRDVDVRMMLEEDAWARWFASPDRGFEHDPTWVAMMTAISLWGERVTGLPIDFQMQPRKWANDKHAGPRLGLGIAKAYPECFKARELEIEKP